MASPFTDLLVLSCLNNTFKFSPIPDSSGISVKPSKAGVSALNDFIVSPEIFKVLNFSAKPTSESATS